MENEGQRELRLEVVLIPETPAKTVLPRKQAICAAMQEDEPDQAESSESEGFPPGFGFPSGFASRVEPDQGVQRQDSASTAETTQIHLDDAELSKTNEELLAQHSHAAAAATTAEHPFSLSAQANAASTTAPRKEDAGIAPIDTYFCISSSTNTEGDCSIPTNSAALTDSKIDALDCSGLNDNRYPICPTNGQQNRKLLAYDLNLPAPTMEDVLDVNPNFAPITPAKPLGKETRIVSESQNSVADQNRQDIEANKDTVGGSRARKTKQSRNLLNYASLEEKDSTDKEDNSDMNLEKTPQKKPRRKKHRPKVVVEEKPKRTPKSVVPKTVASKEQTGKRKYVRRKRLETTPTSPVEGTRDSINPELTERPKRSCRRALNFNFDREEMDEINMRKYLSVLELQMRNQQSGRIDSTISAGQECEVNAVSRGKTYKEDCHTGEMQNNYMSTIGGLEPRNTAYLESDREKPLKEQKSYDQNELAHNSINFDGVQYNSLQAYMALSWLNFPVEHKRKRSEKGQQPSSILRAKTVNRWVLECKRDDNYNNTHSSTSKASDFIGSSPPNIPALAKDAQTQLLDKHKTQETGCIQKFRQAKRVKRKRSRVPIRARDFASLMKIVESIKCSRKTTVNDDLKKQQTCMEALLAEMHALSRKKRTKKRLCLVTSAYSNAIKMQLHGTFNQSLNQPEWKHFSLDAITKQLERLDINMETSKTALVPYNFPNQKDNTLVLYQRDGTVVPFEGSFDPMKRRHPRPKVDLDEETTRVWKLLLENINNEGIDGTDEEKERWWKEERGVFKGRADSFIARMRLVQGDRRFSPWKGSVVDSVVGVFLTQNVSDHLSSSAFMSLAARFPYMSNQNKYSDEGTCMITDEPEAQILDTEYTKKWRDEKTNATSIDSDPMIIHEMEQNGKRVVDFTCKTNESIAFINLMNESNYLELNSSRSVTEPSSHLFTEISTVEIKRGVQANYDVISSQNSVISSQNSDDSPVPQNDERLELSSRYSELKDLKHEPYCPGTKSLEVPTSFLQLLHMAGNNGLQGVYIHENDDVSSNQNSRNLVNCNEKGSKVEFSDATTSASSSIHDSNFQDDENTKCFSKEINCSEHSYNGDRGPTTQQDKFDLEEIFAEAPRSSIETFHSWHSCPGERDSENMQTEVQETFDRCKCRDSKNIHQELDLPKLPVQDEKSMYKVDISENINQEEAEEYGNDGAIIDESNDISVKTSKTKTKNKEKERKIDWDNLRKQVEASGRRRERTPNTMDTVDWDAVRCTDINEIAETIKDRGMNNVLAGRIKDFLNRLVREHGSTDLEWLRDVPPDKAKEYLLSIRGLGLKSVECVRLLTLHHVAFPVDTNVGRIAVRLGWVPLQPLPESLQLHLLELYPVLESIQKYLWPRLCKLDQGTLYELHYQMITFGKVFCTKSKPNCNACPMRGECRHFASAFTSARLALPGPEEKLSANTVRRIETQESAEQLSLPFPQAMANSEEGHQQDARPGLLDCQPIIEEPATPEPESIQTSENDIEDTFLENSDEIPTIKLNMEEFTENLQNYMQQILDLEETEVSKALVALTPEAAAIPVPKLKNVSRLRTEHLVYELPEGHPLLNGLDSLEPDDPSKYLLAIWSPGETANSIEPPERRCNSQELGILCDDESCFACNSTREANSQTVRGTFLIPCRTAMRGSFPLNGTYFQVNEVFADHETSVNPIDVPRSLLWKLPQRTVYFGTSIPSIFKGLTTEGIQHCFWRGYVCVRGFDRQTRAPRPLKARLHFPPSKLPRTKGKTSEE